ncbi:tyrosine protein phosphatase [Paenibacillus glycanilyticus]|uniref:Tyrosine-protein phosphatase n=2 Tax=Paenibacillus glycanilyticus TaxID=126569 RepID=A0ABQ6G5W2_9BACL|nr:tyrosine protein phosphatase [Paenibacillus glycanilyticus]
MAQNAFRDGITDLIATPHSLNGIYHNPATQVLESVKRLQEALVQYGIPVKVHPGMEVHMHTDIVSLLQSNEIMGLNNSRKYLLLELPPSNIPIFTEEILSELLASGYTPIIAHPERNLALQKNMVHLKTWIEMGCFAQITAGSLMGDMGKKACQTAKAMVQKGLVHLLASDGHRSRGRKIQLSEGYQILKSWTSMNTVQRYQHNASVILSGEEMGQLI